MLLGTDGIIKKIRDRVGTDNPVYLSIDIDTLDPACEFRLGGVSCDSLVLLLSMNFSRAGYWHARDWWLVYARAADDYSWS